MGNIEIKESNLEQIKSIVIKRFLDEKLIKNTEKKDIWIKEIKEGIFVVGKKNIWLYVDSKGETLFSTMGIYKDLGEEKYNKYLKKLGYKEIKDKTGYYHMINIKTGKEIPQESLKYYKIFETLVNVKDRLDVVGTIFDGDETNKKTLEGSIKEFGLTLLKEANKILVARWIKSGVIKPFEINYLHHQKQLSDQETKKYLKQTLTFEYLSNLINNQAIDLVGEQGSIPVTLDGKKYEITFGPITKEELDYYKAKNLINKKMYEELLKILEEHKKLEEKKRKEEKKHIEATKKEISGLENDVTKNLG